MPPSFLLTGMPGSGKTSLIKQAVTILGKRAGGFYTEEIRLEGVRQGFRIITLDGRTARLAHIDIQSPYRVSKYGVDIAGLEEVGVASLLEAAAHREIVVIDEIGKMELFSAKFKSAVLDIIRSNHKVLGTIMLKPDPFADNLKKDPHVSVVTVTRQNRDQVLSQILKWADK